MSNPTIRYRALREIITLCSDSVDVETALRGVLSHACTALPRLRLQILLITAGRQLVLLPDNTAPADGHQYASSNTQVLRAISDRLLSGESPLAFAMQDDQNSLWVFPFSSRPGVVGAFICSGGKLLPSGRDFLDTISKHLSVYLRTQGFHSAAKTDRETSQKRVQEISAIYEISQAFDNVPIDSLLRLITEKAADVMDAQACSLMLRNREKDELVIKASYGLSDHIIEESRVAFGEGVAGAVAKTGRPMLINDLRDDPRFKDSVVMPRPDIVSSISVPLRDEEGKVQGVLSIRRKPPAAKFNEEDIKVFSVFASQAALAISNAQLYASLKERVHELSVLYEAGRELSSAYRLEDASRALVRLAARVAGGRSVMLLLWGSGKASHFQFIHDAPAQLDQALAGAVGEDVVKWLCSVREPRSWLLDTPDRRAAAVRPLTTALGRFFSWVSLVPLVAEDTVVGALIVGDKSGKRLEQRRVRMLSIIASQAGVIIKNAKSYEEEMGRRVLELSALYELSERISSAVTLQEAFDLILDIVGDIVRCDESFIRTVEYERGQLTVQACRGSGCEHLLGSSQALEEDGLIKWAIAERKALLSPDLRKDSRFQSPALDGSRARSAMAIPLIVHDEVVGLLNVRGYAPNLYTEDDMKVLSVIASQAAALYKEMQALNSLANYTDNILRSIGAGVITLDRDGCVLSWNRAAEEISGASADQTVGRRFEEVVQRVPISDTGREVVLSAITSVLDTGERFVGYKQEFQSIDGPVKYINASLSQLRDPAGEVLGLVCIFEDVTEQTLMENEIRRVSDLAAIGQLAANIAHEIRNPLSSIKGAAQFLRKEYSDHAAVSEFLDIIIEEVNVLNKITTEFLDFARPPRLNFSKVDINDVLARTLSFMQMEMDANGLRVQLDFDSQAPRITTDDRQMEQVFRNIVLNAMQAMPGGGELRIRTRHTRQGVMVSFTDTGIGIPEEHLPQVFTPFFTTKTKGTGIGLAVVRKIVDNHEGRIEVRSIVGEGTTFDIHLPARLTKSHSETVISEAAVDITEPDLFRRARG